ncbi:MAG: type II and III secretion system protein family protein, partial [Proteobacteria bacterium]|nr:type II and III secretion system protein family protein [Pseudomonadota bacterium]
MMPSLRHALIRFTLRSCLLAFAAGTALSLPAAPVRADAVLTSADEQLMTVEINKGAMLKLSAPAASVAIADPNIADVQVVSPRVVVVRGKKVGETSFYAVDGRDEPIVRATIKVTHNISSLSRAIKEVAPDAEVDIKTVDGGLLLDGYAGSTAESESIRNLANTFIGPNEKMVNMIKTGGSDQVMLKVKFVEMSRNDLKRLGISLQHVGNQTDFGMQVLQGKDVIFHSSDPTINVYRNFDNVLVRSASNESNLLLRFKNLAGLLDALEVDGLATTLAEPSLVTTSGQTANFLAGGQFPLPIAGQNGQITLEYKPFGVSLNFTPVVQGKDRISLTVAPEVSTLNFNTPIKISNITYPIIDTRRASAVVELGSGDSFMLAGLMQYNTNNNVDKFPALGDLPVLGALFRSTQFQNNQSELVILVTPYVVHPISNNKQQVPTDGYKPATDFQRTIMGEMYQQQPMTDE